MLREHIITLQSRLMEAQAEVPDLPANIDLSQPRQDLLLQAAGIASGGPGSVQSGPGPQQGQHPGSINDDMNSLNRIAVAGLGMRKHPDETNFMHNNFAQQNKRMRPDDQGDGDVASKQEATHGLPLP